jgi:hypothetical protein
LPRGSTVTQMSRRLRCKFHAVSVSLYLSLPPPFGQQQ